MTPADGFYQKYQAHIAKVARSVAPVVKRYGWDAEDCHQQASMRLWELAPKMVGLMQMADNQAERYLTVVIRRDIIKAARKDNPLVSGEFDRIESKHRDHLMLFVTDLIADADNSGVREYLTWLLLDGPEPQTGTAFQYPAGQYVIRYLREKACGQ